MTRGRPGVFAALIGLAVVASSAPLWAQQSPRLEPGQRVRVTARSVGLNQAIAIVESLSPHEITLGLERSHGAGRTEWADTLHLSLPLDSLQRVDVSVSEHGHAWAGAALGAVVGALVGYAAGSRSRDVFEPALSVDAGVLLGIPIGLLLGANVRSDDWRPADLTGLRVGVPLAGGRLLFGAVLAF